MNSKAHQHSLTSSWSRYLRLTALGGGLAALFLTVTSAAGAAVWTVCPSGCSSSTLQGAIDGASPGDTIQFVGLAAHIEEDITVDRSLTILGAEGDSGGLRAALTRGAASSRVLTILPGVFVEIRNLSIGHGNALDGGGILNLGQLVLDQVFLIENDAQGRGGGLYNSAGAYAVLRNSVVQSNEGDEGGGLHNEGTLRLEKTLVTLNGTFGNGGGLYSTDGSLVLHNVWIDNNEAEGSGGGIAIRASRFEMRDSLLSLNTAQSLGGGIVILSSDGALIEQTTVVSNAAETGGGLFTSSSAAPRLHGVTMVGNLAKDDGGGIYVYGGKTVRLASVSIVANGSNSDGVGGGRGGGIRLGQECSTSICFPARVFLENSVIGTNTDDTNSDSDDCLGTLSSNGHNLVGVASTGAIGSCKIDGDLTGVIINVSPGFGSFGDHGGPTTWGGAVPGTVALLPNSLAIDAGDPSGCTSSYGDPLLYDQRYASRVGTCDLGAFERGGLPVPPQPLFNDGFEIGSTALWSVSP